MAAAKAVTVIVHSHRKSREKARPARLLTATTNSQIQFFQFRFHAQFAIIVTMLIDSHKNCYLVTSSISERINQRQR